MPQDYPPTGGYITDRWYDSTTVYSTTWHSTSSSNSVIIYSNATDMMTFTGNYYYPTTSTSSTSTVTYYTTSAGDYYRPNRRPAPAPTPTPEEAEAFRERCEARRRETEERERTREAAKTRAEALLRSFLTEEQRQDLEINGRFQVVGGRSGRRYCINRGYAGNVICEDGRRYCAHAPDRLPDADHMLSQKLALELDEDSFLAVANVS